MGMEARAPKAKPQTQQLGGRRGKKNGGVNSSTPGSRCVGRPALNKEAGCPFFFLASVPGAPVAENPLQIDIGRDEADVSVA